MSVFLLAVILGLSGDAPGSSSPGGDAGGPTGARTPAAARAYLAQNEQPSRRARATPPAAPPEQAPDPQTARIFAEARVHFDAGTDHYAAGRYEDAIRSFQAGYTLVPRPSFLVNIGQAYRKLGNLTRAKEAYVAYVRALPENSAIRDQALQVLAEIEVQLHDGKEAQMKTELTPKWDLDPPAPAGPPVVQKQPAASRTAAWVGFGFGGVGLGLVATGMGFQLRAKSASDALAEASRNGEPFNLNEERAGKRAEKIGNGLFFAGGAVMAAGLLIFLVVDAAGPSTQARLPFDTALAPSIAVSPDSLGLGWRF